LGVEKTRELATAGSLTAAQRILTQSPYRRDVQIGATLRETEFAVSATLLWQLRVLAGWQPRAGASIVRTLAGGFEVANITALAATLAGAAPQADYELGALDWAWSRLREARSLPELRAALAHSVWGDPGAEAAGEIADAVALAWAARVAASVTAGLAWAHGAAALLLARRRFVETRLAAPLPEPVARQAARLLGDAALAAPDLASYRSALPSTARWALSGVGTAADLWRAEFSWWRRLAADGANLLAGGGFGPSAPIGATALLAADAWRVRAALQVAAGAGSLEAFDELV
jgi:hypothetical protein